MIMSSIDRCCCCCLKADRDGDDDWKNIGDEDGTAPPLDFCDPFGDEGGCGTGVDDCDLRDECPLLRRDAGDDILTARLRDG